MQFKLLNPINNNLSTTQQILYNRNIPLNQIQHYLNTTEQDINPPELFGEQLLKDAAAALIRTIKSQSNTIIVTDCDTDGYTASAILINYLYTLFPAYINNHLTYYMHDSKQHGLKDCINWILEKDNVSLVICPDSASNDYEQHKLLKQSNITTIVLDHHDAQYVSQDAIVINNQLSSYPNKNLSGAGVVWQFCRYLDKILNINNADKYRDLVALGLDADMMSLTNIQTKHLINTGFSNPTNPFIVTMAKKNEYSLKGKLTPIGVAFYIAPFVNAMTRSGTIEEKKLLFQSMLQHRAFIEIPSTKRGHAAGATQTVVQQAVRVATNVKNRQTKAQNQGMDLIESKIQSQNLLQHKVLLFLLQPGQVDRNIAGLVANKIMAKYQRPVCVLTKSIVTEQVLKKDSEVPWNEYEEIQKVVYSGSARGYGRSEINDFKDICLQTGVCNFAQGHPQAFGISIDQSNISTFVEKTDQLLKDISSEPIYYVDYIYNGSNINIRDIYNIAKLENLWGQDIPEPYVAIKNLKITPSMVTIYDKKDYTIKISLHDDLALLKFKATEEDCQKLQTNNTGYVEINLVGRCNQNQWNGYITPQIFIQQYQIIDSSEYYF